MKMNKIALNESKKLLQCNDQMKMLKYFQEKNKIRINLKKVVNEEVKHLFLSRDKHTKELVFHELDFMLFIFEDFFKLTSKIGMVPREVCQFDR